MPYVYTRIVVSGARTPLPPPSPPPSPREDHLPVNYRSGRESPVPETEGSARQAEQIKNYAKRCPVPNGRNNEADFPTEWEEDEREDGAGTRRGYEYREVRGYRVRERVRGAVGEWAREGEMDAAEARRRAESERVEREESREREDRRRRDAQRRGWRRG